MLTIDRWSIFGVELAYLSPVTWAHGVEAAAPMLLLRLQASNGCVGLAEVTVRPKWYGTSYKSLVGSLEEIFLPMLKGLDITDPASFASQASEIPENLVAKAVVDNALWDLRAASTGMPLWKLWHGRGSAEVCWLVSRQSASAMIEESIDAVGRMGIRTLKIKGGQGLELDMQIIRELKAELGESAQLFVDANWHYTSKNAGEYIARVSDLGAMAVEDPCRFAPNRLFQSLQSASQVPLIVDFFASSLDDMKSFHEHGLQALSLKPLRIGLSECLRQAQYAAENGIRVHVGFGGESSIGSLQAVQFASTLWCADSWLPAETTFFLKLRDDLLHVPLSIKEGRISLPHASSLVEIVDLDKAAVMSSFQVHG